MITLQVDINDLTVLVDPECHASIVGDGHGKRAFPVALEFMETVDRNETRVQAAASGASE